MLKIIKTNANFNIFTCLLEELKTKSRDIENKVQIFCEDKISLMTENAVVSGLGGSFNISVDSFARFLLKNKRVDGLLSKEGSSMVIKKLLKNLPLKLFNANKTGVANSLYNAIIQLKSAKITLGDLLEASSKAPSLLQKKLEDLALVYSEYQEYLLSNGASDQSTVLKLLPSVISELDLSNTDVIILGYVSFTAQIRESIKALATKAKSVTAILPYGENEFLFVNETAEFFEKLAKTEGLEITNIFVPAPYVPENAKILDQLFSPLVTAQKLNTDKIVYSAFSNTYQEIEGVAEIIRKGVTKENRRYKDFKVAVPNGGYLEEIKKIFSRLEIPYFYDEKKKAENHPAVTLILSYILAFRKNLEQSALANFYKNPLVCQDKGLIDSFENYVIKYAINFNKIKKEFTLPADGDIELSRLEEYRKQIVSYFNHFNVKKLLEQLDVDNKLEALSQKLLELNESAESAVCKQIYQSVVKILDEIDSILGQEDVTLLEYESIFKSGISALEISILPQRNDAVFIGDYNECSLTCAPVLFAVGLTSQVPSKKEDVSLLTDEDINLLSGLKLLIEPKIKVVNHRERQTTALGLTSFSHRLYLSYPTGSYSGEKIVKSQILSYFEDSFTLSSYPKKDGYLTVKQGLNTFANDCARFARGVSADFSLPSAYYTATTEGTDRVLKYANAEIKTTLDKEASLNAKQVASATAIERYQACPYRYFIERGLMVTEREIGGANGASIGTLMHEVFCDFIKSAKDIKLDSELDKVYIQVTDKILEKKEYKFLLDDPAERAKILNVIKECKKYCIATGEWINSGKFNTDGRLVEVEFSGDKKIESNDLIKYPAISLNGGKVKLSGKIDRVDLFGDYFRVIDYKTGGFKEGNEYLYGGLSLQLYLYALAVNDKKIAGAYYFSALDEYKTQGKEEKSYAVGKTLNDQSLIISQDSAYEKDARSKFLPVVKEPDGFSGVISEKTFNALIEYSKLVSEKTVENIENGYIAPSPIDGACKYCPFKSLCGNTGYTRTLKKVSDEFIEKAVEKCKYLGEYSKGE